MKKKVHDENWQEVGDPTPVEVPLNFRRPPTLQEQMKAMIRNAMSEYAAKQGKETFAEANDFGDDEDEPVPVSGHEFTEMQEEYLKLTMEEIRSGERARREAEATAKEQESVVGANGIGKEGEEPKGAGAKGVGNDRAGEKRVDGVVNG